MKHIGILAHSFEGANLCYRTMCLEGVARLGPHRHPEITLTGIAMDHMLEAWDRGDLATLRAMFMDDMVKLAATGCDFFICPDNTAHIALESVGEPFPIPCLHIGEVVAGTAAQAGYRKVGILGTNWTMDGPVYPGALGRRGIGYAVPDKADRDIVHAIIMDELCLGMIRAESRAEFKRIIDKLAGQGCDAVALVCTEIPLLVGRDDCSLPILDSTRLLARAAVEVAIGDRPTPSWLGGPVD